MIRSTRFAGLLFATLATAASALPAQSAEEVLAHMREATGIAALRITDTGLLIQGESSHYGADGHFEMVVGPEGRFRFTLQGGVPTQIGYDGTVTWEKDWMHTPRVLQLEDHEEALVTAALRTGLWLAPSRDGFFEVDVEAPASDGELVLRLRLASGRYEGLMRVSTESWLPLDYRPTLNAEAGTLSFGDWKRVDGALLAHQLDQHAQEGLMTGLRAREVGPAPQYLRSPFALHVPPGLTRFDDAVPPELPSKLAPTGHVLVQVAVDGSEARWFIFDTGAGALCLDKTVSEELETKHLGTIVALGVGGREPARLVRSQSLQVGPLQLDDPVYVELDLSFLEPYLGEPIAGIVGYGVLARGVVELDMLEGKVALHPSEDYELTGAEWQELILSGRQPSVKARFEGDREGIFKFDSGAAGSTVLFHAPAVRELKLLEGRETTSSASGGVGGMVQTRSGELEWFEIAGHRTENPTVGFALEDKGAFANPWVTGNLGGCFLAPFRLVFDYGRQRMAFVPRGGSN